MATERELIYLAALLHDIGKFFQRGDDLWNGKPRLDADTLAFGNQGLASYLSDRGTPSHQHVYWTYQFLKDHKAAFQRLGLWQEIPTGLLNVATFHHRPQNQFQAFVTLADAWASGLDRSESASEESVSDVTWGWNRYKRIPLLSIFGGLLVDRRIPHQVESEGHVFGVEPHSLRPETVRGFPLGRNPPDLTPAYRALWDDFTAEFDRLPTGNGDAFAGTLLHLLRKYTWAVPASTVDFPDNSLFDHLRLTAALAQSLYDYWLEAPDDFTFDTRRNRWALRNRSVLPLQLVCVDLSGIQSFLYSIASAYAARSLKGRSFSLQLLLDDIARRMVQETATTPGHVVYSSGGKFFLLLPNIASTQAVLRQIEDDVQRELWEAYGGAVSVGVGSVAFAYDNALPRTKPDATGKSQPHPTIWVEGEPKPVFLGGPTGLWRRVTERAAARKSRKFEGVLTDSSRFASLFGGQLDQGGLTAVCVVTGEEGPLVELGKGDEAGILVSKSVKQQIEIGEDLRGHTHRATGERKNLPGGGGHRLPGGVVYHQFHDRLPAPTGPAEVTATVVAETIDFLPAQPSLHATYGYRFFGGSCVALHADGKAKTFEELAAGGNYNRLGFLRMDVDNLGKLFIGGFGPDLDKGYPDRGSFSAYATLSGYLDWFFSGYLNTIRNRPEFEGTVNVVYSGGDDVFAVGRWDAIIAFAQVIRAEFRTFVGREDLSISGGIAFVGPKFPIAKAAERAGEAEDQAKAFKRAGREKDALCLFGLPVGWEEFPEIERWKTWWVERLRAGTLSKGLLQRMFGYFETYRATDLRTRQPTNDPSWKWNAAYTLARQAEATRNPDKKAALDELKNLIFTEIQANHFRFEAFIVACRWAELAYRDEPKL